MRHWIPALAGMLLTVSGAAAQPAAPSNAAIAEILADRIETRRQGVGIVVGVVTPEGSRVVPHGIYSADDPRPVDAQTLFEIGSLTKMVTALLLADMVVRGEVKLDDPAANYLPGLAIPERNGRKITLADLATHTSGLPRLPTNMAPADPANPYADYTRDQLATFLQTYELPRDIGSAFEYSNLGVALLGAALARAGGADYETLVRSRILVPLGMSETLFTVPVELAARLAPGHDAGMRKVPAWDLGLFAPAGALHSTIGDLLKFVAAASGMADSPLRPAFETMLETERPMDAGQHIALGWMLLDAPGGRIAWHNGITGGQRAFTGFRDGLAVVALANMQTEIGVDDIGLHLFDAALPLSAPPPVEVQLDPALFDPYVGRYRLAPEFELTVTREGDGLFVQATGQQKLQVFPESETEFFYREVDARLSFTRDAGGTVTGLVLHQGGNDTPGEKLD